jgi:hypothetical protein
LTYLQEEVYLCICNSRRQVSFAQALSFQLSPNPFEESIVPRSAAGNGTAPDPTQALNTPAAASPGRDANGRFAKGNPGGPGNPFARRTARLRRAFSEAVSEEDLVAVVQTITRKAKEGDLAAAKLLLAYVVGKPGPVIEPDTLDLAEFKHYEEEVRHYRSLPAVAASADLGLACTIARAARPAMADTAARDLGEALVTGEFPEGSPFHPADELVCEELPDGDTAPSPIGANGAAGPAVVEDRRQAEEMLEALTQAAAPERAASKATVGEAKVDANLVAVAMAMLYQAIAQANGGTADAGAAESPGEERPGPSGNRAIGGDAQGMHQGRRFS